MYHNIPEYATRYYNILQYTIIYYNILYYTTIYYNIDHFCRSPELNRLFGYMVGFIGAYRDRIEILEKQKETAILLQGLGISGV